MRTPSSGTAVVGAGTMGRGIAQVLASAGADVVLIDVSLDRANAATAQITQSLERAAARGLVDGVAEIVARIHADDSYDRLAGVGLVIEAVPEDPVLKLAILPRIEAAVDSTCLIGTNTSSISIERLGAALNAPERFCGLHFFNPVPASLLIEIVRGSCTSSDAIARASQWVAKLGKQSIVVRDSPGFASSRLGSLLGLEAMRMVEEGVASPEDIDKAMVLGYRFPMGPLELSDLVGIDVRMAVADYLASTLGPRFEPPRIMREMVARGDLGKKTGQGFYTWPR